MVADDASDAGSTEPVRKEAGRLTGEGADVLTGLVSAPVAVAVADEPGGPHVFRVASTDLEHGRASRCGTGTRGSTTMV